MLCSINLDVLEVIMNFCSTETYYNSLLISKTINANIKLLNLNNYFVKKQLAKINKKSINFCTNSRCPNKLHMQDSIVSILKERNLDVELMMEYKDMLYRETATLEENRFDKTLTCQYPNLKNLLKIPTIPYCEDCLIDYNPDLFNYIESKELFNY